MCNGCIGRQRAALIVANKADLPAADAGIELLQAQIRNLSALHMRDKLWNAPVIAASALHGTNMLQVSAAMRAAVTHKARERIHPRTGASLEFA